MLGRTSPRKADHPGRSPSRVSVALSKLGGHDSHLTAALLLAAASVAYLLPVLVGGSVLSPATMLYDVAPWAAVAPSDAASEYNRFLSDHPTAFHPWLDHARDLVHDGELPAWNPYALSGTPFWGNAQAALLSPFTAPVWVLPLDYSFGVQAAIRLWVAAFGCYLLVRELGLGYWPGLLGGIAYGFSPILIIWLSHPHANVLAVAPWVLLALERVIRRGGARDALFLALAVGAAMLGGHPGSQLHLAGAGALYFAVRMGTRMDLSWSERGRRGALALGGGVGGVALAAVAVLPAFLLVPGSSGVEGRTGGGPVVPLGAWKTLLFPDWWGRPSDTDLGGPFNYNERTLYPGVVALILAVVAVADFRRWRAWLPFVAIAVVGVTVPLGVPPFHDLLANLPGFENVQNARYVAYFSLGVAVLAAFGLEKLGATDPPGGIALAAPLAVVALALAAAVSTEPSLQDVRTTINHFRTGTDYPDRPPVIRLTAIGWPLLLAGGLVVALLAARRARFRGLLIAAALALAALDFGHFARGFQPMPREELVFPEPPPPAIEFLRDSAGDARVAGIEFALPPDAGMVYRLKDIRGHDPPEPDRRYLELFRVANPAQPSAQYLAIPQLTPDARRVMDILGVRYIIEQPGQPRSALAGLRVAYDGADARVYHNRRASPRVYLPDRIRTAANGSHALRALTAAGYRPGRDAVVEELRQTPSSAQGRVSLVEDSNDEVVIQADLDRGGLLVVNDRLKDGWSVDIDGEARQAIRVNSVMRGVVVPTGSHVVTWRYRPPGFTAGLAISALALLVATGLLLHRGWKRRGGVRADG